MKTLPPYPTFGAVLDDVQDLAESGWRITPSDHPEACEVGFLATKQLGPSVHQHRLVWRPYGRLLTPTMTFVEDEDDFYVHFEKHFPHRLFKCDDPSEDLVGFVCYCKQKHRQSIVVQFSLDFARDLGPTFLDAREAAQKENLQLLLADA